MSKPAWPEILLGEQLVFSLLGRALRTYDDRAWLQSLANDDVFRKIPFSGDQPDTQSGQAELITWSEEHRGGMTDKAFESLRADFTRLFVGPDPAYTPPWESVYFNDDRLTFEEQTVEVRSWYRRYGLEPEELYHEPDDHIALELTFVGYLAGLALEAYQGEDASRFHELLEAQRGFFEEHLFRWAPQWCNRVTKNARTAFYRGIALITKGALRAAERVARKSKEGNKTQNTRSVNRRM